MDQSIRLLNHDAALLRRGSNSSWAMTCVRVSCPISPLDSVSDGIHYEWVGLRTRDDSSDDGTTPSYCLIATLSPWSGEPSLSHPSSDLKNVGSSLCVMGSLQSLLSKMVHSFSRSGEGRSSIVNRYSVVAATCISSLSDGKSSHM